MAYTVEEGKGAGDIVIGGFDKGVGVSPYAGLSDVKGVNISSIPGEASVSFSSSPIFKAPALTGQSGTVNTTSGGLFLAPTSLKLEWGQWIEFTNIVTSGTGLSLNTPYYLVHYGSSGLDEEYQLYSTFPSGSLVAITANSNVTFNTIGPSTINFFQGSDMGNFALDSNGRVWSDRFLTSGGGSVPATYSWVWIGNSTDSSSNGNGLLIFKTVHNGTGGGGTQPTFDEWLFVWRNSQIDYTQLSSNNSATNISWVYGWNYKLTSGTTTGYSNYLNTLGTVPNPHPAMVTPDSRVNFCDGNYIGNWYQNVPLPGSAYVGFDPTNGATYTPNTMTAVMPESEVGQCLTFVNQYLLVGGKGNIIYPWDLKPADNTYSTPLILLPENNIQAMVTVGNNAYIFAGDRGNIYITNGSQASFFAKVPDHISNQVEPYYKWGALVGDSVISSSPQCAAYTKNRIYFSISGSYQNGSNVSYMGGLWCVDLATNAIYQAQQMSYGDWNGSISAIYTVAPGTAGGVTYGPSYGYGFICGWKDATGNFGTDVNISTPYTNGNSWVASDIIPVGLSIDPTTPSQIEFKLSQPLVSGESLTIDVGSYLDLSYSSFKKCTFNGATSFTTTGVISGITDGMPDINYQWIIVRATLSSVSSNPSYVRIYEMRIKNATSKVSAYYMQTG